jgi:linoleoyl-CoA desaturase
MPKPSLGKHKIQFFQMFTFFSFPALQKLGNLFLWARKAFFQGLSLDLLLFRSINKKLKKMNKLNFKVDQANDFYTVLRQRVTQLIGDGGVGYKATTWMYGKLIFYFSAFALSFIGVLMASSPFMFYLAYIMMGLTVLGIVFNASHDAAHQAVFASKTANKLLYYISFTLLGNNPFVWKKYHLSSHHLYTNVEGSDIDVIRNRFIRLHANEPLKPYHRYQHIYSPFLYLFYTLNFVIFRDIMAIFRRSDRTIDVYIPAKEQVNYAAYKTVYFTYTLIVPLLYAAVSWEQVVIAFFLMHFICSLCIISVLACNHQVDELSHYSDEDASTLNTSWASLQMSTSLDYNPDSKVLNFLLGGFNAHTVHHLFPTFCHVHYLKVVPVLRETAKEFGIKYHETSYLKAMASHFRFLKKQGNPLMYVVV